MFSTIGTLDDKSLFILPSDYISLLHIAAYCDSLESFIFLNNIGISIDQKSVNSYLPIHYACLSGSYEIVAYILSIDSHQASIISQVEYHQTYLATISGNCDILRLLFEKGAKPQNNNKSVRKSIKMKNSECLRILLENESKKYYEKYEYSNVMTAIANGNQEAVPLLFEYGDKLDHVVENTGETALSLACFQNFQETVKFLCDNMHNIEISNQLNKKAAVHWICGSKNIEIVKMVLDKNIDINRLDEDGHPGPYYMIDSIDEDDVVVILQLLFVKGLNLNNHGNKANSILGDFVLSIQKPLKVIGWLLQNGADANEMLISPNVKIIDFVKKARNNKLMNVFEKYNPLFFQNEN